MVKLPNVNTPKTEIEARIFQLQSRMADKNIDGVLILQNTDLFYFAGTIQQSHLFIPQTGDPLLMVKKDVERAKSESPLKHIISIKSPKEIPDRLEDIGYKGFKKVGLEFDVLPVSLYFSYQKIFPQTQFVDISMVIRLLRAIKSPYEIQRIHRAARLADDVSASIPGYLKEGMTEVELSGKIVSEARKRGHQGIVRMRMWGGEIFFGHIMAGPSAAIPSFFASPTGGPGVTPAVAQSAGFRPIGRNEPVLVDYVFGYQGYISDQTRIFSIGKIDPELKKAHNCMLELQDRIKTAVVPGITGDEIYTMAVDYVKKSGYLDYFMGVGNQRVRFVGHGVGLELDEFPFLAQGQSLPIKTGMTLALEPKLVFPGKGVVGIENTHVVGDKGLEQLGIYQDTIIELT
jgi:Xaa-Pro aminopeptidase